MKHLTGCIFLCAALATGAAAQPLQAVGQGDMRWTFFKLYHIILLSEDGQYKPEQYPLALEIEYYRDIPAQQLIDATRKQMRHIGFDHPNSEQWFTQLESLWPDIGKGDSLRIEVDKEQNNQFFYNSKAIGSIDDTAFSDGFLSIWLSEKTSEPELRQQLITPSNTGERP